MKEDAPGGRTAVRCNGGPTTYLLMNGARAARSFLTGSQESRFGPWALRRNDHALLMPCRVDTMPFLHFCKRRQGAFRFWPANGGGKEPLSSPQATVELEQSRVNRSPSKAWQLGRWKLIMNPSHDRWDLDLLLFYSSHSLSLFTALTFFLGFVSSKFLQFNDFVSSRRFRPTSWRPPLFWSSRLRFWWACWISPPPSLHHPLIQFAFPMSNHLILWIHRPFPIRKSLLLLGDSTSFQTVPGSLSWFAHPGSARIPKTAGANQLYLHRHHSLEMLWTTRTVSNTRYLATRS